MRFHWPGVALSHTSLWRALRNGYKLRRGPDAVFLYDGPLGAGERPPTQGS